MLYFFQSSVLWKLWRSILYRGGLFFQNGARRIQSIRMIIMPASNNEASARHFCEQSITNL